MSRVLSLGIITKTSESDVGCENECPQITRSRKAGHLSVWIKSSCMESSQSSRYSRVFAHPRKTCRIAAAASPEDMNICHSWSWVRCKCRMRQTGGWTKMLGMPGRKIHGQTNSRDCKEGRETTPLSNFLAQPTGSPETLNLVICIICGSAVTIELLP